MCFLFAACHVSCFGWHAMLRQHSIHKIHWPMTCSLTSACTFSLLPENQSVYTSTRSCIHCLLAPIITQCCFVIILFSLAWVSLIQPDSYITFPVPSDIPSGHISMSKHTHLSLPLSWIDSGLCPPTFPPFSPSPSRVSRGHFLHISTRGHTEEADTHWLPRPVKNELWRGNKLHPI